MPGARCRVLGAEAVVSLPRCFDIAAQEPPHRLEIIRDRAFRCRAFQPLHDHAQLRCITRICHERGFLLEGVDLDRLHCRRTLRRGRRRIHSPVAASNFDRATDGIVNGSLMDA